MKKLRLHSLFKSHNQEGAEPGPKARPSGDRAHVLNLPCAVTLSLHRIISFIFSRLFGIPMGLWSLLITPTTTPPYKAHTTVALNKLLLCYVTT